MSKKKAVILWCSIATGVILLIGGGTWAGIAIFQPKNNDTGSHSKNSDKNSKNPLQDNEIVYCETPVLTVTTQKNAFGDEEYIGNFGTLPMMFIKTNEDKPVRVAIINNTPDGSGDTIRNSVWGALAVAANLRKNTLHSTLLTVEFSGKIDGPSAGGVMCLSILAAIDGKQLPKDYAMTGTILPDGMIGIVGGLEGKITAAVEAEKNRIFLPYYLEQDIDQNKIAQDKLHRLADSLSRKHNRKITLYFVKNIDEVYNLLFSEKQTEQKSIDYALLSQLPPQTVEHLNTMYNKYRVMVENEFSKNSKFKNNHHYLNALHLYSNKKFLAAAIQMFYAYNDFNAQKTYENEFNSLKNKFERSLSGNESDAEKKRILVNIIDKDIELYVEILAKCFSGTSESLKGLQFQGICAGETLESINNLFYRFIQNKKYRLNRLSEKELDAILEIKAKLYEDLIYCLGAIRGNQDEDRNMLQALDTLNPITVNEKAADDLCNFYDQAIYTVYNALNGELERNNNLLLNNIMRADSEKQKWIYGQLANIEKEKSYYLSYMTPLLQNFFSQSAENKSFLLQLGAYVELSIHHMVKSEHQNNELYVNMMNNAQQTAAQSIMACKENNIVCLPAIYEFEQASHRLERLINDLDEGKLSDEKGRFALQKITAGFWRANYYANAFLIVTNLSGKTNDKDQQNDE